MSRLTSTNIDSRLYIENNKLNTLFIIVLIEIEKVFRNKFIVHYKNDLNWQKIVVVLNIQKKNVKNNAKKFFFDKIISFSKLKTSSTIMFIKFVVCIFFRRQFNWFLKSRIMTIIQILHDITRKYFHSIIFVICFDIYEIFWNIAQSVKCIKLVNINSMIFCNRFSFRRCFFIRLRSTSFWFYSNSIRIILIVLYQ